MCRGSPRQSFLAARAIEGRAAGLDDAADSAAAARPPARLALTVIDGEAMLKDAKLAIGPSMVALANQRFPDPYFVNDLTVSRLGYQPVAIDLALEQTVEWLRKHHM